MDLPGSVPLPLQELLDIDVPPFISNDVPELPLAPEVFFSEIDLTLPHFYSSVPNQADPWIDSQDYALNNNEPTFEMLWKQNEGQDPPEIVEVAKKNLPVLPTPVVPPLHDPIPSKETKTEIEKTIAPLKPVEAPNGKKILPTENTKKKEDLPTPTIPITTKTKIDISPAKKVARPTVAAREEAANEISSPGPQNSITPPSSLPKPSYIDPPSPSYVPASSAMEEEEKTENQPEMDYYDLISSTSFVIPSGTPSYQDEESEEEEGAVTDLPKLSIPPHYSALSASDHELYLDLKRREKLMKSNESGVKFRKLESAEKTLFLQMSITVAREQAEYQKWCWEDAKNRKEAFMVYPEHVKKGVETLLAAKRKRITTYPRFYQKNKGEEFDFNHPRCIPKGGDPVLKHEATLYNTGSVPEWIPLSQTLPTNLPIDTPCIQNDGTATHKWFKQSKPEISKDPILQRLLNTAYCDICISSSTLKKLFDNLQPFDKEWKIPFLVRPVATGENFHNVVVFDKPFLSKSMNLREKNTLFCQYAFRQMGLRKASDGIRIFPPSDWEELDRKLLINEGNNKTYTIWSFGNLRILVRCSIAGVLNDKYFQPHNAPVDLKKPPVDGFRYVGIKTKMEYQIHEGYELHSLSESARWWLYSYIRPDAHLVLGHCNAATMQLHSVEYLPIPRLFQLATGFHPAGPSKKLFEIFRHCSSLPVGSYLLSHEANQSVVQVLRAVSPPRDFHASDDMPPSIDSDEDMDDAELMIIDEDEEDEVKEEKEEQTFQYSYDLHLDAKGFGKTDLSKTPYQFSRWPTDSKRIPYTFPIAPKPKRKKKKPRKPVRGKGRARHCFSYLKRGSCGKVRCGFPHLSREQVEEESRKLNQRY